METLPSDNHIVETTNNTTGNAAACTTDNVICPIHNKCALNLSVFTNYKVYNGNSMFNCTVPNLIFYT